VLNFECGYSCVDVVKTVTMLGVVYWKTCFPFTSTSLGGGHVLPRALELPRARESVNVDVDTVRKKVSSYFFFSNSPIRACPL